MGSCQNECIQFFPGFKSEIVANPPSQQQKNKYQRLRNKQIDKLFKELLQKHQIKENQIYKHKTSDMYFMGNWNQNNPEGQGVIYNPSEYLYNGTFDKLSPQGKGIIDLFKTKCIYNGQINNGFAEGKGQLINNTQGYRFKGIWKNGKPKNGQIIFKDSTTIQWENLQTNNVIITYPDKRIYKGEIQLNNLTPNGKGRLQFAKSKSYYQGQWKYGKINGKGEFEWYLTKQKVQKYKGQYKNGKRSGNGTFTFRSGNVYIGEWQEGMMHGQGILYDNKKKMIKKGLWKQGDFLKAQ